MLRVLSKTAVGVVARGTRQTTHNLKNACRALSIKFTPSHEYVRLEGDIGTIGITDHAAGALGDVVYVGLPEVGAKYAAGESFGSVESVKAASDVVSRTGEETG
jgi:Glycine cleavage H-protein